MAKLDAQLLGYGREVPTSQPWPSGLRDARTVQPRHLKGGESIPVHRTVQRHAVEGRVTNQQGPIEAPA